MSHDDHDHPHEPVTTAGEPPAAARVRALEELLLEKGVLERDDVRQQIDWLVSRTPADGARLVARAWVDPDFTQRLLEDARAAALELGLDPGPSPVVVALENTEDVHHLVVCTLCSCYPRALLGPPPDWYKSLPYRSRAVSEPRAVLDEFGVHLSEGVELRVVDSTADIRYLVVPQRPTGTESLTEHEPPALLSPDSRCAPPLLAAMASTTDQTDRLRVLIDAGISLSAELSLDALLQRIVETAAQLTGARYAALGVVDASGSSLERFLTVGVSDEERAEIGAEPVGRGILGVLIHEAHPLRLHDIAEDSRSVGFPQGHPPMRTFLGVPILLRDVVYGNLYLTEKSGGDDFTEEDEELTQLLAAQAAVAVENARLPESSPRWLRHLDSPN